MLSLYFSTFWKTHSFSNVQFPIPGLHKKLKAQCLVRKIKAICHQKVYLSLCAACLHVLEFCCRLKSHLNQNLQQVENKTKTTTANAKIYHYCTVHCYYKKRSHHKKSHQQSLKLGNQWAIMSLFYLIYMYFIQYGTQRNLFFLLLIG